MPIVDVAVPQMGEGLQEVMVVEFLKKPGARLARDEAFYSMETDKATMEVESPYDGVLVEWLASEGDTLAIGAPIARVQTDPPPAPATTAAAPSPMAALPETPADNRSLAIPPRTRAYAKEKGVADSDLAQIPMAGAKLMPADVDAWLEGGGRREQGAGSGSETQFDAASSLLPAPSSLLPGSYTERPLSQQDKTFIYRLKRSAGMVVPAVAKRQMDWGAIRQFAETKKALGGEFAPSTFNCVAWCVARAVAQHPKFRSTLIREETVREFAHVNLGIAVALPTGELTIAVVPDADSLSFENFVRVSQQNIAAARAGEDQANESTQLLLTYMGPYEITDAIPVLVAPAAAVLFIGSAFVQDGQQTVNLALAFDHRLIHGVEAAEFLRTIVKNAAAIAADAR